MHSCIGCGREEAEKHLLSNGPNSWRGKSADESRSLIRDCIYKYAEKYPLMIGGPIILITFGVEKDTSGNRKLNAGKKMIEFPPLTEVFTTTLGRKDIQWDLHIDKDWFETCVFPNWKSQLKNEIRMRGGSKNCNEVLPKSGR